jgi:zinc transport system ATP-binding protein
MNAIEVNKVSFGYNNHPVLTNVSFSINEGSYVGIIGPNGGGKTTLLKIILGLIKPQTGTVKISGQEPIGYVPQRITQENINFPATVEEIVGSGCIRDYDKSAIEHAMKMSRIAQLKNRLISNLSGGERQRVFVARALAAKPKILILDEPFTGIDVGNQEEFYGILKELNTKEKITILFVSHDVDIISNQVKEILCLNRRLVCSGPAKEILEEEVVEKLYGTKVTHLHHDH